MIKLTRQQLHALDEMNARAHWLALPVETRDTLDAIAPAKWNMVLQGSKFLRACARLAIEREACLLARERVAAARTKRAKEGFGSHLRGFVSGCAAIVGVRVTARTFGLADSQVSLWKKNATLVSAKEFLGHCAKESTTARETTVVSSAATPPPIPPAGAPEAKSEETSAAFAKLEAAFQRFAGKTRRRYSRSEKKAILTLADEYGAKEVYDRLHVSYDTIARLVRRAGRKSPEEAGEIPARYGLVVEIMKKHPGLGPMQIRDWIARHHGQRMGVNTVREVMERAGWVPPLVRKKEFRPGQFRRYEAVRRNVLWHGDFLHVFINTAKVYILLLQDDHSRFILGFGLFDGEKAEAVLSLLDDTIARHGRPEVFMADRGAAFRSWRGIGQVTRFLEELGVDQHVAVEARINGKVENLNQQVQKELLDVRRFSSLGEFQEALAAWVEDFNFRRCHQGLAKLQVPADRFYPGAMDGYAKAADRNRGQSEMLHLLQEIILATRGSGATAP